MPKSKRKLITEPVIDLTESPKKKTRLVDDDDDVVLVVPSTSWRSKSTPQKKPLFSKRTKQVTPSPSINKFMMSSTTSSVASSPAKSPAPVSGGSPRAQRLLLAAIDAYNPTAIYQCVGFKEHKELLGVSAVAFGKIMEKFTVREAISKRSDSEQQMRRVIHN